MTNEAETTTQEEVGICEDKLEIEKTGVVTSSRCRVNPRDFLNEIYQYQITSTHQSEKYPISIKRLKLPEELANYALAMAIILEQCNGQDPYDYVLEMAHTPYTMTQGMKIYGEEVEKK